MDESGEIVSGVYTADPVGAERWQATWVPADQRLLGMSRRTLLPAALVVLLFVVCAWVLPAVDDAVTVDDPIRAGDIIQIGTVVQFTPAAGANLLTGLRQGEPGPSGYPQTAAVSIDGSVFKVTTDQYHGTPAQLLAQIEKTSEGIRVTSEPAVITTASGQRGVSARYESTASHGLLAAFVIGASGIAVKAVGPQAIAGPSAQVTAMLQSMRPVA